MIEHRTLFVLLPAAGDAGISDVVEDEHLADGKELGFQNSAAM